MPSNNLYSHILNNTLPDTTHAVENVLRELELPREQRTVMWVSFVTERELMQFLTLAPLACNARRVLMLFDGESAASNAAYLLRYADPGGIGLSLNTTYEPRLKRGSTRDPCMVASYQGRISKLRSYLKFDIIFITDDASGERLLAVQNGYPDALVVVVGVDDFLLRGENIK